MFITQPATSQRKRGDEKRRRLSPPGEKPFPFAAGQPTPSGNTSFHPVWPDIYPKIPTPTFRWSWTTPTSCGESGRHFVKIKFHLRLFINNVKRFTYAAATALIFRRRTTTKMHMSENSTINACIFFVERFKSTPPHLERDRGRWRFLGYDPDPFEFAPGWWRYPEIK
jgi:hypothetical protein